jgi:hypothetical protein
MGEFLSYDWNTHQLEKFKCFNLALTFQPTVYTCHYGQLYSSVSQNGVRTRKQKKRSETDLPRRRDLTILPTQNEVVLE